MKNNENDIIDIPTELEIEEPAQEEVIESLEPSSLEAPVEENISAPSVESVVSIPQNEMISPENPIVENNNTPTIEMPSLDTNLVESNEMPKMENTMVNQLTPDVPETLLEQPSVNTQEINLNASQDLEAISLGNNTVSLDGNPDELDIEVKGLNGTPQKKSNKGLKIFLLIFLALAVLGGSGYWYYNYLVSKKAEKPMEEKSNLKIATLSKIETFEEAYNKVSADFVTDMETDNLKYIVKDGVLEVINKDNIFKVSLKDIKIVMVSSLKSINDKDIIGLKDSNDNYYFAHINHNISKDVELNYKNNKLLTINNDGSIKNIAIADYLNDKGYFYLAEKDNGNFFIGEDNGNVTTISEVYLNVYNGINIDFNDLNLDDSVKKKLNIDGIGLFYDGSLYMYKGDISQIKEIEVKVDDSSLDCSNIYLTYSEKLDFLNLYIVTKEDVLYQMNLLEQEFDETKIELKEYDSPVVEETLLEVDGEFTLEIILENDEKISLK